MTSNKVPIFGDDGFRSKFGEGLMSIENITKFCIAFTKFLTNKKIKNNTVIIARDTRSSGIIIEKLIVSYFNSAGINTESAGVITTPGLSKILEYGEYSYGIMITASHNKYIDNGIKLFGSTGYKMTKKDEQIIEKHMINKKLPAYISSDIGKHSILNNCSELHLKHTKYIINTSTINNKILIDCSNGAIGEVIDLLSKKFKNLRIINNNPNGKNINLNCGALEPEKLVKNLKSKKIDYGVAFDGDGDRAIFACKKYGIIETDKLFYLFATNIKKNSKRHVASEIINYGIIEKFRKSRLKLYVSKVGDRNVVDKVQSTNSEIGVEPSGHYHFSSDTNSMDGLIAFFHFLNLINSKKGSLNSDLNKIKLFKRIIKNINIENIALDKNALKKINSLETTKYERIIARLSIWEPKLRIYYDYKDKNKFNKYYKYIEKIIFK